MFISTLKGFSQYAGVDLQDGWIRDVSLKWDFFRCVFIFNMYGNPFQMRRQRCRCQSVYLPLDSSLGMIFRVQSVSDMLGAY